MAIPKHVRDNMCVTTRTFKEAKRRILDCALFHLDSFATGSAHIPDQEYKDFAEADRLLKKVRNGLKQKNWGR